MNSSDLHHFQRLDIKKPTDVIFDQLRGLVADGTLQPGEKLPPERVLSEQFGVGRGYVREAIKKLEFYGILKTTPNHGTEVVGIGEKALEGVFSNILTMTNEDVESIIETRAALECHAARMAAVRGTQEDFSEISQRLSDFKTVAEKGQPTLEADVVLHLRIAQAAKNNVMSSLIWLIIPDVMTMHRSFVEDEKDRFMRTTREHEAVVRAILERDGQSASEAMRHHLRMAHKRRLGGKNPEW